MLIGIPVKRKKKELLKNQIQKSEILNKKIMKNIVKAGMHQNTNHLKTKINSVQEIKEVKLSDNSKLQISAGVNESTHPTQTKLQDTPASAQQLIKQGEAILKGQTITLNPFGILNIISQRLIYMKKGTFNNNEEEKDEENMSGNLGDFFSYFGSYDRNQLMKNDVVETGKLNDYILSAEQGFGRRHFMIHFSVDKNGYFLKDGGEGSGTFIKVDQQTQLKNGHIVSFGDNHMVVGLVLEKKEKEDTNPLNHSHSLNLSAKKIPEKTLVTQLMVQFIDGPKTKETFSFKQEDVPIFIGRSQECKIFFKTGQLSRIQCRIDFIDDKWILKDGNGIKSSTNGTWLFAGEDERIYDGMVFKAGRSLFQTNLAHS
eukprot:403335604